MLESEEWPELAFVRGMPGVGKSALLREFARRSAAAGEPVFLLDCRMVEPTEAAFRRALAELGLPPEGEGPVVLCLDHDDHFWLLDAWLLDWFRAQRPGGLRLVLAGRKAPHVGWLSTGARLLEVRLGGLAPDEARCFLADAGMEGESVERILELTRGHPMALYLAATAAPAFSAGDFDALALPDLVHRLSTDFVQGISAADLREAVEAAAAVRRLTQPLLDAVLEREVEPSLVDELAALPLIEVRDDGLSLHPTVHTALARWLHSVDPNRFSEIRRKAWCALDRDRGVVSADDWWGHTADVIYLIEDPIVREAFFPSTDLGLHVAPATAADREQMLGIAAAHDDEDECARLARGWDAHPEAFFVVRDRKGVVQGFSFLVDAGVLGESDLAGDDLFAAWYGDLPPAWHGKEGRALFLRRWLSREEGDAPSLVQAACWLDVMRAYLEKRPELQRVYLAVSDLGPYGLAAAKLGFTPVCLQERLPHGSAMLDLGPGSVDAWLADLLRAELGEESGEVGPP